MEFRVIDANDRHTHVWLSGRMDAPGVDAIESAFHEQVGQRGKPALVEMAEVSYLSSIGIRLLMMNLKALSQAGVRMVLVGADSTVRKVLETSGLGAFAPCVKTLDEARRILE